MVAVPASAASRQRWLTLEAFRRAGFAPIGLVNEPTAAAIEFAHRHLAELGKRSPKRYVVVYDLGGGTFDTSAVSLEGRRFELIASEGLAQLGGDDFDELILDAAGVAPTARHARARARGEGDAAPDHAQAARSISGPASRSRSTSPSSTRAAQPLIDRTIAQTDLLFERLRERGIDPDDAARARRALPRRRRRRRSRRSVRTLRARFGKKLQLAPQPFAATAVGLAIAADPDAHVMIREAITRHFGVWREADAGADKIFDPLIGKNTAATASSFSGAIARPTRSATCASSSAARSTTPVSRSRTSCRGATSTSRTIRRSPIARDLAGVRQRAARRPDVATRSPRPTPMRTRRHDLGRDREHVARLRAQLRARRAALMTVGCCGVSVPSRRR